MMACDLDPAGLALAGMLDEQLAGLDAADRNGSPAHCNRRRRREALRRALVEQRMIFDNAAVGILFVRNRRVQRCNAKAGEIYGCADGELVGKPTGFLYAFAEDYADHVRRATEAIRKGEVFVGEARARRKNGSLIWIKGTARGVGSAGSDRETIWILEDVTERKRAEQALNAAHDELESRVAERTRELELANRRLQLEFFERAQAERRIWQVANHDALTGLANRIKLHDRLSQVLRIAERRNGPMALLFADIDRFKGINDTLGHEAGDRFLRAIADRLRAAVRAADIVARIGADEFVVVLHELQCGEDALLVAKKLRDAMAEPVRIGGHAFRATASIGISRFPEHGRDGPALLRQADIAMRCAKAKGRNGIQVYSERMAAGAARAFNLEQGLRGSAAGERFELLYQPIVGLECLRVRGVEALLRWRLPDATVVSPAEFIPVAEETDLILPIGQWALREACRQMRAWHDAGHAAVPVSVNLSPRQFWQPDLVDVVLRTIEEHGVDPQLVELEITETTLMRCIDDTLPKLRRLADGGIRLAIDDFGTGYSSLSYLKRLPVSKLKIDQSFVRELDRSAGDGAIVAAIIGLADSLGLKTVAEGVETAGQLEALRRLGCGHGQGFHFSRPVSAGSVADLIERRLPYACGAAG